MQKHTHRHQIENGTLSGDGTKKDVGVKTRRVRAYAPCEAPKRVCVVLYCSELPCNHFRASSLT
jgi:hypothetical protein